MLTHPFLMLLAAASGLSPSCRPNPPADVKAILGFGLTPRDIATARRIEAWQDRHARPSKPTAPVCANLRRALADIGADGASSRFIAHEDTTARRYVLTVYTIAMYRDPASADLPPRGRWTATMRRNAALVAAAR